MGVQFMVKKRYVTNENFPNIEGNEIISNSGIMRSLISGNHPGLILGL